MPQQWRAEVVRLATDFPLRSESEASANSTPGIADPIDTGCLGALGDLAAPGLRPTLNFLEVETLLDSVLSRLSTCLQLRERAQDLEMRALNAALEYQSQKTCLNAARALEENAANFEPLAIRNATTLNVADGSVSAGPPAEGVYDPPGDFWHSQKARRLEQIQAMTASLEIQRKKASTPGNGSNFAERFAFLREVFFLNLREAYTRARSAQIGLRAIYGIDSPLPPVTDVGYLNRLVLWAQKSSDALDRALDGRYFGTVAIAVAAHANPPNAFEILTREQYAAQLTAGSLRFTITSLPFDQSGMRNPRLRSIEVQIKKGDELLPKSWPLKVTPPIQTIDDPQGEVEVASQINLVASMSLTEDVRRPRGMRDVHNIDPRGVWQIDLPSRALTGQATNSAEIFNIFLYLRLSYQKQ